MPGRRRIDPEPSRDDLAEEILRVLPLAVDTLQHAVLETLYPGDDRAAYALRPREVRHRANPSLVGFSSHQA